MADTLRIKRRAAGGAAGAPASLAAAEIAYNEQDDILYYGRGNSGGMAVTIIPIAGPGAFQQIGGAGAPSAHGFTAYSAADQTITTDTWTKLNFGTTAYNNGSSFSTSTSRYTPPAGETCFAGSVYCEGVLPGSNYYLAVYKNGTILHFATANNTNGVGQIICSDQANGTDYYELWVFASTGGPTFSVLTGNNDATYFQGFQPIGPTGPQGPPGAVALIGTPTAGQIAQFTNATTVQGIDSASVGWSTGDVKITLKAVADNGWVMMDDGTIGDASSSGTTRANADCQALFTLVWTNINDSSAPVPGGRGASAAADWAAHKRITLPRTLGRALASAGAGAGLTSRPLGGWLGEENHSWVGAELIAHNHAPTISDPQHYHSPGGNGFNQQASYVTVDGGSSYNVSLWGSYYSNTGYAYTGISTSESTLGSSSPPNVMQPTTFMNFMVKL